MFRDRTSWLIGRAEGIGASDAASIIGISPWKSNLQLWLEKTGQRQTPQLDGNAAVEMGNALEDPVRQVFRAKHPEYIVTHFPFDILYQTERPWLRATLDGEIIETATGRRGIYEGKTATCIKRSDWAKWQEGIPEHYLAQCLWQLLATGWDFVILTALLMNMEGDRCEYREYLIERDDYKDDLQFLLQQGEKFWRYVEIKTMPPMVLK